MSTSRYSQPQASAGYPPTAAAASYAPVPRPTPPHLAHARYSSADLYAAGPPPDADADADDTGAPHSRPRPRPRADGNADWNSDSDSDGSSDDDDGGRGGFGTYRDFNVVGGGGTRGSRRISHHAPTLSTPRAGGASTYALKDHPSSTFGTSTTKLDAPVGGAGTAGRGGGAYETVALPKISRDWDRGEGLDEKNYHRYEKSRRKRKAVTGVLGEYTDKVKHKWKLVVPLFIAFIVALILVLYFCIPRTPTLTFRDSKVPATVFTSTDETPFITSTDPVSYYFNANLILGLDASKSYVPVHYSSFGVTVKLRETGGVIGRTVWDQGEISIPGKQVTSYEFPIYFSGNYTSTSDPTFAIMKSSCAHLYPTTYRAPLNLTVEVESKVVGVVGSARTEASIANVTCPIQWSGSAN
ncbi:hypothetical protein JCM11491_005023 [Sporobolomyces phaffii]